MRVPVMDDGAAINRAVLALIPSAAKMPGGHRHRAPAFHRPTGIIDRGGVVIARDFTPNGPIQAGDGRRVLQRLLLHR